MLSRLADPCYWLGRYTERAAHIARVVGATQDFSLDPDCGPGAFNVACAAVGATAAAEGVDPAMWLVCGEGNPSALAACVRLMRDNARAVRVVVGDELWESTHAAAQHLSGLDATTLTECGVAETCSAVLADLARCRGTSAELVQDGAAPCIAIGAALERIDVICRTVGGYLAEGELSGVVIPGTIDFRRWRCLLESLGVAHQVRQRGVKPGDLAASISAVIGDAAIPGALVAVRQRLIAALALAGDRDAQVRGALLVIPTDPPGPALHAALMQVIITANQLAAGLSATGVFALPIPPLASMAPVAPVAPVDPAATPPVAPDSAQTQSQR